MKSFKHYYIHYLFVVSYTICLFSFSKSSPPLSAPDRVELEDGFTRDVRQVGHFGTGDLEVTIRSNEDLARAMPLIRESYENS